MKKKNFQIKKIFACCLVICIVLILSIQFYRAKAYGENLRGIISISGAWALYPIVVKWAEEFHKIHPKMKIAISAGGTGNGMADALAGLVDIGMVSRNIYPAEIEKGVWWISVVKEAVVPTVNEKNPFLENLLANGIKKEKFIGLWITVEINNWDKLIADNSIIRFFGARQECAIHVYTRSDVCGTAQTWAQYLGKDQEDLFGIRVYGEPGMTEAIRNDPLAIGYNNVNYVYHAETKKQVKGLRVVPIDLNSNGRIDWDENFYHNWDEMVKGIAKGKYNSIPARDLYFVSQGKPKSKAVITFITWVLTEGQRYVSEAGYIKLPKEKLRKELKKVEGGDKKTIFFH